MPPSRSQVQIAIGIAALVWAVMLLMQGVVLKTSYLRPYSLAVSVAVLALLAFDRWLWRVWPVTRLVHRPVLRGTWKGKLISTWIDPSTGNSVGPIDVFLVIRQSCSTLSMRLITKESSSHSLVAALESPRDGAATVSSTYQNIPNLLIQDRSRIHHGALMLEVHGKPASRLTGFYWTDRDTKGELVLEARSPKFFTTFDEASAETWASTL
jgi:hypothetical protein